MKAKFFLVSIFSLSPLLCALSQIPQGFNYQAIARNSGGTEIANATIKVKMSVMSDTLGFRAGTGGVYVWEEEHTNVKTNSFGMFTIVLGSTTATKVQGSAATFSAIDWSVANLYVGTKIANPTTYTVMGAAKIWSVPYALRSQESGQWTTLGANIYKSSGNVGIGTASPSKRVHINNTSPDAHLYISNTAPSMQLGNNETFLSSTMFGLFALATANGNYALNAGDVILGAYGNSRGNVYINSNYSGSGVTNIIMQPTTGNVGIGATSPGFKLDVVGRSRFQAGGGSAGFWLTNSTNTINRAFVGMGDTDDHMGFWGHGGAGWGLLMNVNNGNVGIGELNPAAKLHVNGTIKSNYLSLNATDGTNEGGELFLAGAGSNPGLVIDNHTGNLRMHTFANGKYLHLVNGLLNADGTAGTNYFAGNVGIGTTSSSSKVVIQPPPTWDDNTPLFEVKNKLGFPILAVYNNGVRILVEDTDGKGAKGGFAVGGFDPTKAGETFNLMMVSPDSVRFTIDDRSATKSAKGGFAVGSFDNTKALKSKEYMYISPNGTSTGKYNVFVGYQSGQKTGSVTPGWGEYNSFMGYMAGYSNRSGHSNVFLGHRAGYSNFGPTTIATGNGFNNIYIGKYSGENALGGNNVFIGNEAGRNFTSGIYNTVMGSGAGSGTANGSNNTYIGYNAGRNVAGSNNVFLGYNAGNGYTESNCLIIGPDPNALITGYFNTHQLFLWGKVGVGTSTLTSQMNISPGQVSLFGTTNPYVGMNNGSYTGSLEIYPAPANIMALTFNSAARISIASDGKVGIGRTPTTYKFEVEGNASKTTAGFWEANSDARIKTDIEDIDNAFNTILNLRPVKFKYSEEWKNRHPSIEDKYYYNFIAQEYSLVFPESVRESGETLGESHILQMDSYNAQIVAIKAVQDLIIENREQKKIIDEQALKIEGQERSISELRERVSRLEALAESVLSAQPRGNGK